MTDRTPPVLFLVFNRPETTAQVFSTIRAARPKKLYIAADGPRSGRIGEPERVARVRDIATRIDWPCNVYTLFHERNLGCKRAVSTGIDWFFQHEECGIILEDDCLPHTDFFQFCSVLLERYAKDDRVSAITGNNFQGGRTRGSGSYYFSRYNHVWGWATWRRAWRHYDGSITFWPQWRGSSDWRKKLPDRTERRYWTQIFDKVYADKIDTWDYPWTASVWHMGGLTATPNVNLVSNIGFGSDATHTIEKSSNLALMPVMPLKTLKEPDSVVQNHEADLYIFEHTFNGRKRRFPYNLYYFANRALKLFHRYIP